MFAVISNCPLGSTSTGGWLARRLGIGGLDSSASVVLPRVRPVHGAWGPARSALPCCGGRVLGSGVAVGAGTGAGTTQTGVRVLSGVE